MNLCDAIQETKCNLFDDLIKKTTDFEGCLRTSIENDNIEYKYLYIFFEKTTNFEGCLLGAVDGHDIPPQLIRNIIEKTANFDGCLLKAMGHANVDHEILNLLFEKTTDFEGCLLAAENVVGISQNFLERLFEKTNDFHGCLYAMTKKGAPQGFLERLFEKTIHFDGCLLEAITRGDISQDFLDRLFEKTDDFEWCLSEALSKNSDPRFLDRLIERTECFEGCLSMALKHNKVPLYILQRLFLKTNSFDNCLLNAISCDAVTIEFLSNIFKKTTNFKKCLFKAVEYNKFHTEFLYRLYDKTRVDDIDDCFSNALKFRNVPSAFIVHMAKNTKYPFKHFLSANISDDDVINALIDVIPHDNCHFIQAIRASKGLARESPGKSSAIKSLIKFAEKIKDVSGCLEAAIDRKFPTEFLDILLKKGGKISRVIEGYEKYCFAPVENKECFICLMDFEEDDSNEVEKLKCGHLVHRVATLVHFAARTTSAFRCPYPKNEKKNT